jgi:cysteine desulfurase
MDAIYLDHNATTPVRPEVVEEMGRCLAGEAGNPSSLHGFGRRARALRETARERVAAAVGCRPAEVIFTSGGTEADNLALRGLRASHPDRGHVVTSPTEHEAILHTVHELSGLGVETSLLPVDREGCVTADAVDDALRPDTLLVTLMAANNETGVLADLPRIGEACRRRGIPFHTDAVQLFGKMPFRFDALPVDLASVSSHKIGGPKGVGALIVREGIRLRPMQTGGSQERGVRPGTENLPGLVGFGKAAELAVRELETEGARWAALRDRLERGILAAYDGAVVNGGGVSRLPNTSNVSFAGLDGATLLMAFDLAGVAVSTGAACHAGAAEPSHVLLAMGRTRNEAGSSLRFSLGSRSEVSDIEGVLEILPRVLSRLAGAGSA